MSVYREVDAFGAIAEGQDIITDFEIANDFIELRALFDALGIATDDRAGVLSITPDETTPDTKFVVGITGHKRNSPSLSIPQRTPPTKL